MKNYIENDKLLPMEYVKVLKHEPLLIKVDKYYLKYEPYNLFQYINFARFAGHYLTKCQEAMECEDVSKNVQFIVYFRQLVNFIVDLSMIKKCKNKIKKILLNDIDLSIDIFDKINYFQAPFKKKLQRILDILSGRATHGERSYAQLLEKDPKTGKLYFPRPLRNLSIGGNTKLN